MAKKRTLLNGYGKFHQRAQARGTMLMQAGLDKAAGEELAKLSKPNPIGGFTRQSMRNIRGH